MNASLYGLVLAGGRSTRMQRDKAALSYHGRTQLEWAMELIAPHVERAFVSVRPDQANDPVRTKFARIVDRHENLGPIAGIAAAQAEHPEAAWLVLACDLPFLDGGTLKHLIWARQPERQATAYRSSHDGLPEPLCAIYEPASRAAISAYIATGKHCPRKFLLQADAALIDEPNPRALDNVNTPEEYGSAMKDLSKGPDAVHQTSAAHAKQAETASVSSRSGSTHGAGAVAAARTRAAQADAGEGVAKRIKVQYYALLREQAGRSEEDVATLARTPRELYEELRGRYPFSLAPEMLRVAVNSEFGDWSQPLAEGDSVVFIPPVAGG
jgi:molybdopterin-guanine dinucleotide biosynthesis protein A